MEPIRVEKWGDTFRVIRFKTVPHKQRDEPHVHKISHEDEGEFWERKWTEEEERDKSRFESSIARARSRIRELAYCNPWDFFATFTLSEEKQDRFDLRGFIRDLGVWIGNYNKKYKCSLKYIIIPEHHKNGAWHAHGLLYGLADDSLCVNEHGFLDLPYYRSRFGYISLSRIKDNEKTANYITKYVTKSTAATADTMQKGAHLFYASRGLSGREIIWQGTSTFYGGYDTPWCTVKYTKDTDEIGLIIERGLNYEKRRFLLSDFGETKGHTTVYHTRTVQRRVQEEERSDRPEEHCRVEQMGKLPSRPRIGLALRGRGKGGQTAVNAPNTLTPEELEEVRREHELGLLRRKEQARVAYAVSRPSAMNMEQRTRDVYGEQLTFLGLLNRGEGLHNGT